MTSRCKVLWGALWALVLAGECCRVGAATFPLTWRWSNPAPHGNNIIDTAHTNGFWIQVAERGQIYTSGDFVNWTPRESHTRKSLRAVTFFKDLMVIVGEAGTTLSGPSASELTLVELGTPDWLEGIAASDEWVVAVGDSGAIYRSPNGRDWQRQNLPSDEWLRSVAYGNPAGAGLFVAVGEGGFVASSADGANWQTQARLTTEHLNRVVWSGKAFWTVGDGGVVFQSATGKAWSAVNTGATNTLNFFTETNDKRVIAGDGELRVQTARIPWTDQLLAGPSAPPRWTYLSGSADTNTVYLAGRSGMMLEGVFTDGTPTWSLKTDSLRNWLWDVKRFPSTYLAVGDRATILSSIDGIEWDLELPPEGDTSSIYLGVGGWTNLAVAVGNAGRIITSADQLQSVVSTNRDGTLVTNHVSTLGIYWQAVQPPPTSQDLQGITGSATLLVASGGGGTILTSSDGKSWTRQPTPTSEFLSSVAAGGQGFVAVGKAGTILHSGDGANWTVRPSPTSQWIYRVRHIAGRFVAVGQNGTILISQDGLAWTARNSGVTQWLNDVQWLDGTFFAVGNQGTVLTSSDGDQWTDRGTITGKSLFGASHHDGMLITVGVEGLILRSQVVSLSTPIRFLRYPARPEDAVFLFSGLPGQRFTLDRSADLRGWTTGPLLEIETSGTMLHLDTGTNTEKHQFFRATLRP
jgi:hypothetical protein